MKSDQTTLVNYGMRLLVERLKQQMSNGYPRFGIPKLAPVFIPFQNFTLGGGQWMRYVL